MNTRLKVSEVMNADPVAESGDPSVMEAARIMRDNGVGCLLLLNGREPRGIVTERDILHKIVAQGVDPAEVRVSHVMTRDPVTITSGEDILDALRLMRHYHIRRLPVVDRGRLVGLVTERDISEVAPELLQIAEDWRRITDGTNGHATRSPEPGLVAGHCEECGQDEDDLFDHDGTLLCEDCHDERQRGPTEADDEGLETPLATPPNE